MVHFMPGCNLATGGSLHRRRRSAAPLFPAGTEVILLIIAQRFYKYRYLCDNGISYMYYLRPVKHFQRAAFHM